MNLRIRLILYFTSIGLMSVLIISIFVNFFLEKQFKEYAIQKQEKRNLEIATLLASQYLRDNEWNILAIQRIGVNALEEGLIVRVTDNNGTVVWDAVQYNSGICEDMLHTMARRMESRFSSVNGGVVKKNYNILSSGIKVGTLEIGFYGPYYYSEVDLFFIDTFNTLLLWLAVFTIVVSMVLGLFFSSRVTRPIMQVIRTAQSIEKGDYSVTDAANNYPVELAKLVETINSLSRSLSGQESLRKQLTADIAHELRTPMTTLQGYIEAMIDGVWEVNKERLEGCYEEILRLTKLIKDLNTLARYDTDKMELELTEFDLKGLIEKIMNLNDNQFSEKGVTLHCTGDASIITADRDKVSQVFINLYSNSLKFTGKGDSVSVEIIDSPEAATVIFEDTGEGIPEQDLAYIFERFYRADKSRNRGTGGSGIGLTIVNQIIKAHHATIDVKSEVGTGTEFVIQFPKNGSNTNKI
ncbi:MAG: HAMP domain-containing histidine kinase [Spirochaetales bacterium]|nr:HAMP domain-containing histidine kinase [Spirochaetales bacterium]